MGGGIATQSKYLNLSSTSIVSNNGGIYGGGIYSLECPVSVAKLVTITQNIAQISGSAYYVQNGDVCDLCNSCNISSNIISSIDSSDYKYEVTTSPQTLKSDWSVPSKITSITTLTCDVSLYDAYDTRIDVFENDVTAKISISPDDALIITGTSTVLLSNGIGSLKFGVKQLNNSLVHLATNFNITVSVEYIASNIWS